MPPLLIKGFSSGYEIEHLMRVFYPGAPLKKGGDTTGELLYARATKTRLAAGLRLGGVLAIQTAARPPNTDEKAAKLLLSRLIYELLHEHTGLRPPWGMLTGVRPVNLLRKQIALRGQAGGEAFFRETFQVSEQKLDMAKQVIAVQRPLLARYGVERAYSLYVSIPFCPSRCAYCSFVSRTTQQEGHLVEAYLEKLAQELELTAQVAAENGLVLASVYLGGGTPTALSARQLESLLQTLKRHFSPAQTAEYTVEAGRPDCTDREKLNLLKDYGVGRISINPQTLSDTVLRGIGRRHTAADILRCYEEARQVGHDCINMDLIAGLPGDDAAGFAKTVDGILALAPENITLHSLTLKRASNLVIDRQTVDTAPARMMDEAYGRFAGAGYVPYYLYRQKGSLQNLENTGWCKPGTEGIYNTCIMEEAHTILAVGAGASTKLVKRGGTVIKRRYNHKLPLEYIQNFPDILVRKKGVNTFYASNLDPETIG